MSVSDDYHQMVPSALLVHEQAPAKCHYWQLCQLIPSALSACHDPAPAYSVASALESDLFEFPHSQALASCHCQVHGRNSRTCQVLPGACVQGGLCWRVPGSAEEGGLSGDFVLRAESESTQGLESQGRKNI